jgi:bifunctional non-homologous end joining protein LigD
MAKKPKPRPSPPATPDVETSIEAYRRKRDFGKTPEPAPESAPGRPPTPGPVFVVHRHEARRLHYDLRLEMEGVLKSFAVPKGFSYVPADKHLAVRTEDHPLEYDHFEGVIPKGEYGAGTMTIYDRGTYRLVKADDGVRALEEGKLEFVLYGGRLRGQWHLVKTARGEKDWLLFKFRDRYARGENDPVFPLDLSREPRTAMPKRPRAMRPKESVDPFSDAAWIFELKFSGVRLFAAQIEATARFLQRDGTGFAPSLPAIVRDLGRLRAERSLIDGVLVALDDDHRPDRELLATKLEGGDLEDLVYYVFDLLYYDEWNLRRLPLLERKRALQSILPPSSRVLYVDHVTGRGEELHEMVTQGGLAGMVAKRADSPYRAGRSPLWREIPAAATPKARGHSVLDTLAAATGGRRVVSARVKITHRNKVYWPARGITKGQLLEYYDRVADVLVPYLRDRPIHMLRYPEGIEGESFYQKKVDHLPDWVKTVPVREKDGEPVHYVVCNDRETLLYMINLGSIDLHPWMSRYDDLESPDWAILDLDPTVDDFSKVIRIARSIGKLLRGAGLRPLLKTSGATGLHVVVPLQRGYSYEQSRMFCELVARMIVREHKGIATVERSVAKREDLVYIDYLQNIKEQTVVPAYVARPVPGAHVSAPLDWDELESDLRPSMFDIFNMPARLEHRGDLFRGALDDPQDLRPAIEALAAL